MLFSDDCSETAIFPSPLPIPPRKYRPLPSAPSTPMKKRPAEAFDDADIRPSKRPKQDLSNDTLASPSKKRRLEEDGLLMLDDPNEKLDDEPELITIDD